MMLLVPALLGIGLTLSPADEFTRAFDADAFESEALDAGRYGEADAFEIGPEGLRIRLEPGDGEAGWKIPQMLRVGGDFTIVAEFDLDSLPKPAQEDGVAVGLAIATQDVDQPDAVLIRLIEPDDSDVYRSIGNPNNAAQQSNQMMMMQAQGFGQAGPRAAKPPRPTFPADGDGFRLLMIREGQAVRYEVSDSASEGTRYVGRATIGPGDLAGVKIFALNRNGAEAVDVLVTSLTIRADRLSGLGTTVRTAFGEAIHGEPIGIEDGALLLGEPTPAEAAPASAVDATQAVAIEAVPGGETIAVQGVVVAPGGAAVGIEMFDMPAPAAAAVDPPEAGPAPEAPPESPPASDDVEDGDAAEESETDEPPAPEPKATVPLDEIDSIRFERSGSAELSGRLVGQPNLDLTGPHPSSNDADDDEDADEGGAAKPERPQADDLTAPPPGTVRPVVADVPKVEPEPNGIRDLQIALAGLRDAEITQVTVNCPTDEGQASWRLDTSGSTDWPLVVRRAGLDSRADLFLEPPPADCFEKPFQINITYDDGQSAALSFQADVHSDPGLSHDPEEPAPPEFGVRAFLAGGQSLTGTLDGLDEDGLRLAVPWGGDGEPIAIPLDFVLGILVGLPDREESDESFAARLDDRGPEDLLLARTREGEVVPISGIVEGLEGDRVRFLYQEQSRTVPLRLIEGLILADRPIPDEFEGDDAGGPIAQFSLSGGQGLSGVWRGIDGETWTVGTAWGSTVELPSAEVQSVRFRGGRVTYLSDLEPSKVEQTPYFGRLLPWKRDQALGGGPLTIDGRTYDRGIAVHSRCELTYDLDGRFGTFEAVVGFDDEAGGLGRVDCRVFADDEELFAEPDLRADSPPLPLKLSVEGARTLRLLVDFGADQDTGDRLIWADARLDREPPGPADAPDPETPPTAETNR